MNREELQGLLINYRSYRYAVANGDGMDLSYGVRVQYFLNSDRTMTVNEWDYHRYSRVIKLLEGALDEVLNDDERDVIRMKYLDRNKMTLERIAERKHMHPQTVKGIHKRALRNLMNALLFVEVPEIHNLDSVGVI